MLQVSQSTLAGFRDDKLVFLKNAIIVQRVFSFKIQFPVFNSDLRYLISVCESELGKIINPFYSQETWLVLVCLSVPSVHWNDMNQNIISLKSSVVSFNRLSE